VKSREDKEKASELSPIGSFANPSSPKTSVVFVEKPFYLNLNPFILIVRKSTKLH
jgi:hypothetical protein